MTENDILIEQLNRDLVSPIHELVSTENPNLHETYYVKIKHKHVQNRKSSKSLNSRSSPQYKSMTAKVDQTIKGG